MKKSIRDMLDDWPRNFIRDIDLATFLDKTDNARHALVKRLLDAGVLKRMRRGLYLITSHTKRILPDEFELAMVMYEPSIISFESALSYHGWIPEVVYTTTCATTKRAVEFDTYLGIFSHRRVPSTGFHRGVVRYESSTGVMFIADPWRALADFIYVRRKTWPNLTHLDLDLRIDTYTTYDSDVVLLQELCLSYQSAHVRKQLKIFLKEIMRHKKSLSS